MCSCPFVQYFCLWWYHPKISYKRTWTSFWLNCQIYSLYIYTTFFRLPCFIFYPRATMSQNSKVAIIFELWTFIRKEKRKFHKSPFYFNTVFRTQFGGTSWKYSEIVSGEDCAKQRFKIEWTLVNIVLPETAQVQIH